MCKYNPNYNLCFPSYPKIQFGPLKSKKLQHKEEVLETELTDDELNTAKHNSNSYNFNQNYEKGNPKNIITTNTTNNNHNDNHSIQNNHNNNIAIANQVNSNNTNIHLVSNESPINDKEAKNQKIKSRRHIPYSEKNNAPNFTKYTGRNLNTNKHEILNNYDNNNEKLKTNESQRKNTISSNKSGSHKLSKKKSINLNIQGKKTV